MTDLRGKPIPLLWNTRTLAGEKALAKGFWSGIEVSMCLKKNEAAWKGCTQRTLKPLKVYIFERMINVHYCYYMVRSEK